MAIELTEAAVKQIGAVKRDHELGDAYGLRLRYVRGADAEPYQLDIEEGPDPRDRSWVVRGVPVFCDPKSFLFLGDVTIDFQTARGGFVVLEHAA